MSKKIPTTETQHEAFVKAAHELGCDESEERFDNALKVIAKHKPKDELKVGSGKAAKEPKPSKPR